MSTAAVAVAPARVRSLGLDAARGLAVLLMIGDHLALWLDVPLYRLTLGRLAMPLFFILAGHLSGRLRWRHAYIGAVGVLLPLAVPWVDSPNVLLWWALGSGLLYLWRWAGWPLWLLVAVPLVLAANLWHVPSGHGYQPVALVGLMALGALLPRAAWSWADRLPGELAALGRYPLSVYVGHLLLLQGVLLLLHR